MIAIFMLLLIEKAYPIRDLTQGDYRRHFKTSCCFLFSIEEDYLDGFMCKTLDVMNVQLMARYKTFLCLGKLSLPLRFSSGRV